MWITPARLPKCRAQKAPLIAGQGGRFAEGSGRVVKSGHVVGLGSSLVLNPSRETKPIGYVDNSGRLKSKACRFICGAGPVELEAFFEAPMHPAVLTRAEKVDLPARIDVHEYVRAHFGPGSERHTEKNRES